MLLVCFCCCSWAAAAWDPTLGFPGEGPQKSSDGMGDYHPFILKARSALIGGTKAKDHLHGLAPGVSPQHIEGVLEHLAATGNSDRPVAARFQTHPENVRRLINDDFSLASQAAKRGWCANLRRDHTNFVVHGRCASKRDSEWPPWQRFSAF